MRPRNGLNHQLLHRGKKRLEASVPVSTLVHAGKAAHCLALLFTVPVKPASVEYCQTAETFPPSTQTRMRNKGPGQQHLVFVRPISQRFARRSDSILWHGLTAL